MDGRSKTIISARGCGVVQTDDLVQGFSCVILPRQHSVIISHFLYVSHKVTLRYFPLLICMNCYFLVDRNNYCKQPYKMFSFQLRKHHKK